MPQSRDWKAPMTKVIRCVRKLVETDGSMVMDKTRRKKEGKLSPSLTNVSDVWLASKVKLSGFV